MSWIWLTDNKQSKWISTRQAVSHLDLNYASGSVHRIKINPKARGFFYLLDYVTPTEIFQIGNRQEKNKTWTLLQ